MFIYYPNATFSNHKFQSFNPSLYLVNVDDENIYFFCSLVRTNNIIFIFLKLKIIIKFINSFFNLNNLP